MDNLSHFDDILLKFALGELSPGQIEIFIYFLEKCPCFRAEFLLACETNYSNLYEDFRNYMTLVFAYAGTLSLEKELTPVSIEDMQIGDVFIQGGSPGHAIIVIDMAANKETGNSIFLLAQSYMPAQDIHILKNPTKSDFSPWYSLSFEDDLFTPEWTFTRNNLRRFDE